MRVTNSGLTLQQLNAIHPAIAADMLEESIGSHGALEPEDARDLRGAREAGETGAVGHWTEHPVTGHAVWVKGMERNIGGLWSYSEMFHGPGGAHTVDYFPNLDHTHTVLSGDTDGIAGQATYPSIKAARAAAIAHAFPPLGSDTPPLHRKFFATVRGSTPTPYAVVASHHIGAALSQHTSRSEAEKEALRLEAKHHPDALRHAETPEHLARVRAPAGGMVRGNVFSKGGQFSGTKAFMRAKLVARLLRSKEAPVNLARVLSPQHLELIAKAKAVASKFRPTGSKVGGNIPTPNTVHEALLHHEPTVAPLSSEALKEAEFARGIPQHAKISELPPNKRTLAHITTWLDAGHQRSERYAIPHLTNEGAFATVVHHLAADANHAVRSGVSAPGWYDADVEKLMHRVRSKYGWNKGDPKDTMFKLALAITSLGADPVRNTALAVGALHEAHGDVTNLPLRQYHKLPAALRGTYVGKTPHEALAWALAHGTSGNPPYSAAVVKHLNGVLVSKSGAKETSPPTIYAPELVGHKDLRNAKIPVGDENGIIRAPGWGVGDAEEGFGRIKTIVAHFGGDLHKVRDFLLTDQPRKVVEAVAGRKLSSDVKGANVPGAFAFGPKVGAFFLNLHSNEDPKNGKYLTADRWFSRTFNGYLGALTLPGHKRTEGPAADQRRHMQEAMEHALPLTKLNSVAELQAALWYWTQRQYTTLGVPSASLSFGDAADLMNKGEK